MQTSMNPPHVSASLARALPVPLCLLLFATPALAEGNLPALLGVVARSHLLLLHFPIAVLFVVLVVELALRRRPPSAARREVTALLLWIAAAGAVLTAGTGLLFAADDDWHGQAARLLVQHRAGGIATAILAVGTAVAHGKQDLKAAYLPCLAVACLTVSFTGHRGGQLVHGDGYLLEALAEDADEEPERVVASDGDEPTEDQRLRWPEGPIPETPDYAKDIKPLIDRSCLKCHGPEKRKSGLRLDKKRFAFKGGETGQAIVPGDAETSLFYKYIALSPDDEDVMPSKGKLLSQSEIETIKKWIAQGASWPDDE